MTSTSVLPWTTPSPSRWDGDPQRVAIVLPGNGYHPDLPLLYWAGKVVEAAGWTVQRVWWQEHGGPPADRSRWPDWVRATAVNAVEKEETADRILLIGKSLGSFAIPLAAERSLPGIWLTPLVSERDGSDVREALPHVPRSLLVGGTDDPSWDSSGVARSRHLVCEIPGANHSLEYGDDPIRSVEALARVIAAIRNYVNELEPADGV